MIRPRWFSNADHCSRYSSVSWNEARSAIRWPGKSVGSSSTFSWSAVDLYSSGDVH
jgi:hypothetical protein